MYDIGKIHLARSVRDAIAALSADPGAHVVCGGSDVLIKIREGKLAGCSLVSINGLKELAGVALEEDGTIVIGPATTFADVTRSPIIARHAPALGGAVDQAGGPQLRNVGTIGGNLCNGATSADSAATLLTLNARLTITGPDGRRETALEAFYEGPGRVRLAHGELLTAIRIERRDYEGFGGHYIKYAQRNAMDIATLGCAVHVRLSEDKRAVEQYRLAFGVAAPTPVRCRGVEARVNGRPLTEKTLERIGEWALEEVTPRTSWRASREFRVQLVKTLSRRATERAILNAGGAAI
ncbi:MAG: xanthine dehydrogenase FAD-binding subunit XdhB [Firmicutes bacterium]|nr:xanthine dehydrogenase FAD-binding subunit XdhB [Bacillota bacterium]